MRSQGPQNYFALELGQSEGYFGNRWIRRRRECRARRGQIGCN